MSPAALAAASSTTGITPAAVVFWLLAVLTVGSAAGVAFGRNILHSAFLLLGTLAGTAGLYLWLGADFVGVTQLLVYVGGVLVLILFAVLLTQKIGAVSVSNPALRLGAAVALAGATGGLLFVLAGRAPWPTTELVLAPTTARLGEAFLREALLPFELVSFLLLAALVGALVVARRAARGGPWRLGRRGSAGRDREGARP